MVFRGAQTHRYGHASCSLLSTRSFPRDSAWLYCQALPFTSTDLGGIAGQRLEEVQTSTDSHGQKSFSVTRSRLSRIAPAPQPVARYRSDLLCTRLLPCRLHTVHLDHLDGASWGEDDEHHDTAANPRARPAPSMASNTSPSTPGAPSRCCARA